MLEISVSDSHSFVLLIPVMRATQLIAFENIWYYRKDALTFQEEFPLKRHLKWYLFIQRNSDVINRAHIWIYTSEARRANEGLF